MGRTFVEAEQREPVAVLSESGRRRHFADEATPVGKRLRVGTTVLTIVGVMPSEFSGTEFTVPDFWVPAEMHTIVSNQRNAREPRHNLSGLLAPGVSFEQAEQMLSATAQRFSRPAEESVARVELKSRAGLIPADEELAIAAGLMFAAFAAVLAIACANLANLCLSRAASRTHEVAMRVSLGASRGRIVRQLLTESTFIALLGAVGGLALGNIAIQEGQRHMESIAGGMGIVMPPVAMDWRVFVFSGCLGVLAGLAFGLLPAIEVTSPSLTQSTKGAHSAYAGRVRPRRMRSVLIAGQVASSLVLLILAGILTQHIQRLSATSPGYDLDRIFDLKLQDPQPALMTLLARQPFVASISAVQQVPLYGDTPSYPATVDGRQHPLLHNHVDHRYFETLALPVRGRSFTEREATTGAKVVVISQATAVRLWAGANPLGRVITIDPVPARESEIVKGSYEVIGVAPDVMSGWMFRGKDTTAVYFPAAAGQERISSAIVRINGDAGAAVAAMRELCAGVRDASGCQPTSLREVSGMQTLPLQAMALIAGALGFVALALTAVGLYSVISYSVVHRRREIGVRLALGASVAQVMRRMVREAWVSVIIGVTVGLPVCLMLSRLVKSTVFGIEAFDPTAYIVVPSLLAAIATAACAIPARRAARVDPMALLREE